MKTTSPLSETYISHGMIIQERSPSILALTIGVKLSGITFDNAGIAHCRNVESAWLSLMKTLSPRDSMKIRYAKSGSFTPNLRTYYEDTMSQANEFSKSQRNAKLCQLHDAIESRQLFRSESHLFFTRELSLTSKGPSTSSAAGLDSLLEAESHSFAPLVEQVQSTARQSGGQCQRLDNNDLFFQMDQILNPSLDSEKRNRESLSRFSPTSSIEDCCLQSDMVTAKEDSCSFFFDGHYHALLLLESLPSFTTSGQILQLTNLPIKELAITTIARPLDLEAEIAEEERRTQKLRRAVISSNKLRLQNSLDRCEQRVAQLANGEASPCSFQAILHLWDVDSAALQQSKVPMMKSAITRFQGAKYYVIGNPVMARDTFLSTLPGIQLR